MPSAENSNVLFQRLSGHRKSERDPRLGEVLIPGHGWRGLDPSHDCRIDETYVKIGRGRDYADVPPISGNYHGTRERKMTVAVKIAPLI
jgi:transglutaminase-like putative cysteine protease